MRYKIQGLNQAKLYEWKLDFKDAAIVRVLIDLSQSTKIVKKSIEGVQYFWCKYQLIQDELPLLYMKSTRAIGRRFKKLEEVGLIKSHCDKSSNGTYTYFVFTELYDELISDPTHSTFESPAPPKNTPHRTQKYNPPDRKVPSAPDSKVQPKDPITINPNTIINIVEQDSTELGESENLIEESVVNEDDEDNLPITYQEAMDLYKIYCNEFAKTKPDIDAIEGKSLKNILKHVKHRWQWELYLDNMVTDTGLIEQQDFTLAAFSSRHRIRQFMVKDREVYENLQRYGDEIRDFYREYEDCSRVEQPKMPGYRNSLMIIKLVEKYGYVKLIAALKKLSKEDWFSRTEMFNVLTKHIKKYIDWR